jgi:hypothetical protein
VTRPHATRRGSGTPRDSPRQRKELPWSETRHDDDGEQLGTWSKVEGFDDKARVVGVDEVVCAHVPESEHVHGLVRRSRASVERVLLKTGFRSRQAERRSGSAHTRERVYRTRARRARAIAWRALARACGREMKLPNEHGGAMVNGSVRLELRDVATGVSAAAWQLTCEGVRAREHAHAPFGQGEQGSTPAGAGVREQNASGEREQPGADKVGRRGLIREARTTQHVLGRVLASLECGEEACAEVSIGRPKAVSMSSLERAGEKVAWPRRRAPRWHAGVFACVRTCERTRALTWPDARVSRRKDVLGGEVK